MCRTRPFRSSLGSVGCLLCRSFGLIAAAAAAVAVTVRSRRLTVVGAVVLGVLAQGVRQGDGASASASQADVTVTSQGHAVAATYVGFMGCGPKGSGAPCEGIMFVRHPPGSLTIVPRGRLTLRVPDSRPHAVIVSLVGRAGENVFYGHARRLDKRRWAVRLPRRLGDAFYLQIEDELSGAGPVYVLAVKVSSLPEHSSIPIGYRGVSQRPAPGTTLSLGVGHYDARTKGGSFWPTPLTIKAVQRLAPRRVYEYARTAPEAVASGRGDAARWVLFGRQLRVTLPRAVDPHARTLVKVDVTCGDDADFAGGKLNPDTDPVWADVAYTQVRVPGKTRQITVRLNRDVARRVNVCELETNPGSFSFENKLLMSAMALRHGTPVGCQPGRLERTLLRQGPVLVTIARLNQDIGNALAYRACLGPRRPLRPIGHGGAGPGSSGESRDSELFTAAGPWLAWTEVADSNSLGPYPPTLHALNLQSGGQKVTFGDGNGEEISAAAETLGRVVRLAVGPTGTIAWVLDRTQEVNATTTPASAELNVRPVSGPVVTIDRASTAGEIAGLRFSSDGHILSWTHDGVARTAPLPR